MWAVRSKKCNENNCLNNSSYGIEKNKPIKCFLHKLENHIYVLKNKM